MLRRSVPEPDSSFSVKALSNYGPQGSCTGSICSTPGTFTAT